MPQCRGQEHLGKGPPFPAHRSHPGSSILATSPLVLSTLERFPGGGPGESGALFIHRQRQSKSLFPPCTAPPPARHSPGLQKPLLPLQPLASAAQGPISTSAPGVSVSWAPAPGERAEASSSLDTEAIQQLWGGASRVAAEHIHRLGGLSSLPGLPCALHSERWIFVKPRGQTTLCSSQNPVS
ncbi:unnamed protein product [Lepidochelys kempii]